MATSLYTKLKRMKIILNSNPKGFLSTTDQQIKIIQMQLSVMNVAWRISWKAKKANELAMDKAEVPRTLLETVRKRKLNYWGHIV